MAELLRVKKSHLLSLLIFLFTAVSLYSQTGNASHINAVIEVVTVPTPGKKNSYTTTISILGSAYNIKDDKKTDIKIEESAEGKTEEESTAKAEEKVSKTFWGKLLRFLGLSGKDKEEEDKVMLDENGEGDDKGGGGVIFTLGPGNKKGSYPKVGDKGALTLRYENLKEFRNKGKNDLSQLISEMSSK